MPIGQEIAVFDGVGGELQYLTAHRLAPADDGPLTWKPLPEGYEDGLYVWDQSRRAFVLNIDTVRVRRWAAVRAARDAAQDGGCPTPLGRVDTDAESRGKISGSVQMAMLAQMGGQPFTVAWTMQDNTTAIHDASAMIAMGVAVGQHVAACHAEALTRRAAIDAAADADAIAAVPVEGGWPGASI